LGDGSFNPRNVSAVQQVNQAPVDVELVPSTSSADPGESVTFTATLTPAYGGTPSGTVTLIEGSNSIAAQPLSGTDTVKFAVSTLPVGIHSLAATYSGDANYLASSGSGRVIVRMTPTITLVSSTASSGAGWPVTLTATAAGSLVAQAAGTINFMNGSMQVGSATTDSNGVAVLTTSALPAGSLSITAVYIANQYSDSTTSDPVALTITPDYTVSSTQTTATVRAGQSATYTLTIAGF
jgi:hypothetical protein